MTNREIKGGIQDYPTVDSPAVDSFESIVTTYYQFCGYITSTGKWFWAWPDGNHQPGYQDIDVLAINRFETIVISVTSNLDEKIAFNRKGVLDSKKMEKLVVYFERAYEFLASTPEYKWLTKGSRRVKRLVVCANWSEKNLQRAKEVMREHEIGLKTSAEIFEELEKILIETKERGLKTNDPIIRFLRLWLKRGPK